MSHSEPTAAPLSPPASDATRAPPRSAPQPAERLQSLDAYRGLIMVSLAFAGFGLLATARHHLRLEPASGFWRAVEYQFEHVDWQGCSYWDLIQPSFMFMVGVSMAYSYVRRQREGQRWAQMFGHACWRAVALVFLGIFLISNSRSATEWSLVNVLTQIGLGYPFLFLLWGRSVRVHAIVAAALLLGTWLLYVSYPGAGVDPAKGAPAVQAILVGLVFWGVCWWMYRRKIFLRI